MEVSKYDKGITYLGIKSVNFAHMIEEFNNTIKNDNSLKLIKLSNKLKEAHKKLSKIDKEYYIDKDLKAEVVMIIANTQRVEHSIIRFLENDIPYSKFALDSKEITDIALKNVSASLRAINRHMEKAQTYALMNMDVLKNYINGLISILDILKTPTDKLKQLVSELENTNKNINAKELLTTVAYLYELEELTNEQFVEELIKALNKALTGVVKG